jgi:hypothetical protein
MDSRPPELPLSSLPFHDERELSRIAAGILLDGLLLDAFDEVNVSG